LQAYVCKIFDAVTKEAIPPLVLGAAVMIRKRLNEEIVGRPTVRAAVAKLPPAVRDEWESLGAFSWISLDTIEMVQDAIAAEAGRDPEELHDTVIRQSVEHALHTIYRVVLRVASDRWLVSRTSTIFRHTRKIGNLTSRITTPGRAELVLSDWPDMRDRYARQVAIAVERILTLTGRRRVEVSYARTADGARYIATWAVD